MSTGLLVGGSESLIVFVEVVVVVVSALESLVEVEMGVDAFVVVLVPLVVLFVTSRFICVLNEICALVVSDLFVVALAADVVEGITEVLVSIDKVTSSSVLEAAVVACTVVVATLATVVVGILAGVFVIVSTVLLVAVELISRMLVDGLKS